MARGLGAANALRNLFRGRLLVPRCGIVRTAKLAGTATTRYRAGLRAIGWSRLGIGHGIGQVLRRL